MNPSGYKLASVLAVFYAATWGVASLYVPADRLIVSAVIAVPLIWLSVVDLEIQEIPDSATLTVALTGAAFQWHLLGGSLAFLAILALAGTLYAALMLLGQRYHEHTEVEALGIGDAKLIGAGALCVGLESVWAMIFVAASGGIVAAFLSRRRDPATTGLAFGPFLAYSILVFVLFPVPGLFSP